MAIGVSTQFWLICIFADLFGIAWENTDSHSGTCYDNTGAAPSSCNFQRTSDGDMETYTAQEQLVCVDPSDPGYCAQ